MTFSKPLIMGDLMLFQQRQSFLIALQMAIQQAEIIQGQFGFLLRFIGAVFRTDPIPLR
jgi:hypothetical protein